jgi:hypothetical protein
MSASSTTTPVKRACDRYVSPPHAAQTTKTNASSKSCHRRKVKCIGEGAGSCKNCVSAGLACTYNAIPQKKGPKGSRAKVLSELRENQRHAQLAGLPHELGLDARTLTSFARTPGLLPPGLVDSCLKYFFANVYPSQPVLHRQRIQEMAMNMEHSAEAYCLIVALCAYVLIQANMTVPPNLFSRPEMSQLSHISIGHVLLEEAVRVRRSFDYLEDPTQISILTAWFFYGSYFGLGRDNTAWSYLREATTQVQLLGLHDEDSYKNDPIDLSRKRVLYWLLFVAERYFCLACAVRFLIDSLHRTHALHKHRPITLYPTIHPPTLDEIPSEGPIASGLDLLVNLYKPIDETFVQLWNKIHTNNNPTWLARLQNQLSDALPAYLECTESQAVDLRVTQQWLRTMVWQLCVSQGLVSSVAADNAMTFKYPIEISRDLLSMTQQFSQHAMEVHGMGLVSSSFFHFFRADYSFIIFHPGFAPSTLSCPHHPRFPLPNSSSRSRGLLAYRGPNP